MEYRAGDEIRTGDLVTLEYTYRDEDGREIAVLRPWSNLDIPNLSPADIDRLCVPIILQIDTL